MKARLETAFFVVIVLVYLALALGVFTAPPLEGAEELEHYRFIRTLVRTHALPDPYESWGGQYHQTPLYYLLQAPIYALAPDDDDFEDVSTRLNPFYGYAFNSVSRDNKNLYLHRQNELFPPEHSGTASAVYAMRLFSVALGVGILFASQRVFRVLWPDHAPRRVLALAVVAFQPHFIQVTATINNDNLLILLATLGLWLTLLNVREGPSWPRAAWLGVILGLALLAKVNATFLAIPVGVAVLSDRRSWRYAVLTLGIVALVAGWWYVRNWIKYDDPTGGSLLFNVTQPDEAIEGGGLAPKVGWPRLRFAYETFWARFGDGRVSVPDPVYTFFDEMLIIAGAGLLLQAGRAARNLRRSPPDWGTLKPALVQITVLVVFGLTWIALLFYFSSRAWSGVQGRYLLPGIAAWAALIAWGLEAWLPRRVHWPSAGIATPLLAGIAGVCLWGYYLPAYRVQAAPETVEVPVLYCYEDYAELIGMGPPQPRAHPGETIRLRLYWRALAPTPGKEFLSYVHSVESDMVRRDSHPATGNLLSSDWKPGETWTEEYVVKIPADASPQQVYPLVAGLYDPGAAHPLKATGAAGQPVTPVIGRIAINGPPQDLVVAYRFGDGAGGMIALAQPELVQEADALTICLQFQALRTMPVDYNLFIHVLDSENKPLVQHDGTPHSKPYPTGGWGAGEVIKDCITLDASSLPPTGWHIALGLYNLTNFTRLPVTGPNGRALPNETIIVFPGVE